MSGKKKRVLAVGAHPDDIELGCSGTLRKHVLNADKVIHLTASLGEKSSGNYNRKNEAIKAAELIGVDEIDFLNLPDTMIKHDGEVVSLLDNYIGKDIDIIYVNSPKDYHQDHANISKSVLSASRNIKNSIFFYETPSTTIEFKPTAYIDITDVMEDKKTYIREYSSQKNKIYMHEQAIVGLAKYRGSIIRVEYAEAFEVERLYGWLN